MSRFKNKKEGGTPGISTASLPDIIFMLLFFFMVTTTMRENNPLVKVATPDATEVAKLEKKSLVSYIFIGPPQKNLVKMYGSKARIQLNDVIAEPSDIAQFIYDERDARDEVDRKLLTTSLKVDKKTNMGLVTDVKQELRKVGAFKINYSARKKADK